MGGLRITSQNLPLIPNTATKTTLGLEKTLQSIVRTIRKHLGMDVAFLAEFANGRRFFRYVDSPHSDQPVKVDASDALEASYCARVVDGRLPELIHDAAQLPEARALPATLAVPVGAHLSVPIRLRDGRTYGTLCCFSFTADASLNHRDLATMKAFADLAAEQIDQNLEAELARETMAARINDLLSLDTMSTVYQPIFNFSEGRVAGLEALTRFSLAPGRSPHIWFDEAAQVGRGVELEIKAMALALGEMEAIPPDVYIGVNASPETLLSRDFQSALSSKPLSRIVVEVTEHAVIEHYKDLAAAIRPLREKGLRLAVDDAGAGYASFRHILRLAPDIIKLDMTITRHIDTDPSRRALARAFISFAAETKATIIAEGVESAEELAVLREIGINKAQGHYIAKPCALFPGDAL
jgi:EAL domain-containing protein (putative c-di-GMP-specific phosphodiesterase class I)